MVKIHQAAFLKGVDGPKRLSSGDVFRVGFAGRSNVGKSTFLNRLLARKSLANTSATPGRTREFNVYKVDAELRPREMLNFEVVDFPGFGYAKFSKAERASLRRKILSFVESEGTLQVLCVLNDARRMPEEDELSLCDIAAEAETHVLVVVTKTDKLRRNEVKPMIARIARAYGLEPDDVVAAGTDVPMDKVWERLELIALSR